MLELGSLVLLSGLSFVVGLSGAVSPGPLLVLDIRESARRGFWAGPLVSTGHAVLELGVVVVLTVGLASVLGRPAVAAPIGIVGGLFLLWMAWGTGRSAGEAALPAAAGASSLGWAYQPAVGGLLVTLSNPFWFLWWMTVGAALFARSAALGVAGITAFYIGHILADYSWYSLVSFGVARGRQVMGPQAYRYLLLACALALALLGAYFIASGGRFVWEALHGARAPSS